MAKKESKTNNQEGFSKMSINWYPGHMCFILRLSLRQDSNNTPRYWQSQ